MSVSYNRLWKQLIDKNMKRIEMQHLTGISANILARMGKNQYVSMETVEKICKKMDLQKKEAGETSRNGNMFWMKTEIGLKMPKERIYSMLFLLPDGMIRSF